MPFLFEGELPDLNIGTAQGASCLPETQDRLQGVLAEQDQFSWVINGRFKGGYNTRHYCDPARGYEAIQLEMSQRTYMDQDRLAFDHVKAAKVQVLMAELLHAANQTY